MYSLNHYFYLDKAIFRWVVLILKNKKELDNLWNGCIIKVEYVLEILYNY